MFDGACKGNPGPAGAGAVLRAEDGSKVYSAWLCMPQFLLFLYSLHNVANSEVFS